MRKFYLAGRYSSFNPLPSPKQGEIEAEKSHAAAVQAFQSAPLAEARRDIAVCFHVLTRDVVSIRSPRRSKER